MATERNTTAKHGNRGLDAPQNHKLISKSGCPITETEAEVKNANGNDVSRGVTNRACRYLDRFTGDNRQRSTGNTGLYGNACDVMDNSDDKKSLKEPEDTEVIQAAKSAAHHTAQMLYPLFAELGAQKAVKKFERVIEKQVMVAVAPMFKMPENYTPNSHSDDVSTEESENVGVANSEVMSELHFEGTKADENKEVPDVELDTPVEVYRKHPMKLWKNLDIFVPTKYCLKEVVFESVIEAEFQLAKCITFKYLQDFADRVAKKVVNNLSNPAIYNIAKEKALKAAAFPIYEYTTYFAREYVQMNAYIAARTAIQRYRSAVNSAIPQ
ncbi:MBL fold metallo-hydrolase [Babesia caballi]|uniref:MBL fold metallo-hydrolase n=1 Tax=Babesia caballi TaxID=5871 RepID=A0AAV4M0T4_BABCB|nr:MBL fold metallo-hydrolase [Babesia caballi]